MKKGVKYTEPSNYFSKEALAVFGLDKKEEPKKTDDQRKRENEEVRKIFKGK